MLARTGRRTGVHEVPGGTGAMRTLERPEPPTGLSAATSPATLADR
jgi:hypothetical protein